MPLWSLLTIFLFQVFNNLMVKEHEKRHVVYCLHCSLAQDPNLKGFICLEEYTNEELCKVYDEFRLVPLSAASTPPSGLGYCQQTSKIWIEMSQKPTLPWYEKSRAKKEVIQIFCLVTIFPWPFLRPFFLTKSSRDCNIKSRIVYWKTLLHNQIFFSPFFLVTVLLSLP